MNAIRSHHLSRRISLGLTLVMVVSLLLPLGVSGGFAQDTKTALIFPVSVAADGAPGDIGQRATGALTMAISETPGMDAIQFSPTSPSVRRAVSEGRVRQVDVEESERDVATALTIGAALEADYIIVSSIQAFNRKADPTSVDVILAGQVFEVAPNLNPATGEPVAEPKVFRAFGVSGKSTERAQFTGTEGVLVQEAIRDAASKAALTISGQAEVVAPAAPAAEKKDRRQKWLLIALLVGGLVLAVNNSSGGGGPTGDVLPPRNVALETSEAGIRITWDEPTGTTLDVLRYVIERSVDGGGFTRIDPGNLGPGTTSFDDINTLGGRHTYQYRMRTIYTSASSPFVLTGAVVFTR